MEGQPRATSRPPLSPRGLGELLQSATTWKTLSPRGHQERVAEVMLNHGAQILIKTSDTVAAPPEMTPPRAPTRF